MPYVPPYARGEKISDYLKECRGVRWREEEVRAEDGVRIKLCVTDTAAAGEFESICMATSTSKDSSSASSSIYVWYTGVDNEKYQREHR